MFIPVGLMYGCDFAAIQHIEFRVDHDSWGQRKLDAIKARRAETGESYPSALAHVEIAFPEFSGRWCDRPESGMQTHG